MAGKSAEESAMPLCIFLFFARRRGVLWNKIALLTLANLSLRTGADGRWQHGTKAALFTLARRSLRADADGRFWHSKSDYRNSASLCAQTRTGGYRKQNKKCDCLKQKKVIE